MQHEYEDMRVTGMEGRLGWGCMLEMMKIGVDGDWTRLRLRGSRPTAEGDGWVMLGTTARERQPEMRWDWLMEE